MSPPSLVDQKAVDDAGPVLLPARFLGGPDDLLGYDLAVRTRNLFLGELAWYTLLDQMAESECDLCHVRRRDSGLGVLSGVDWKDFRSE